MQGAHKLHMTEKLDLVVVFFYYILHWQMLLLMLKTLLLWRVKNPSVSKDLTDLCKKQMVLLGAATEDIKYIQLTRLKNQIL